MTRLSWLWTNPLGNRTRGIAAAIAGPAVVTLLALRRPPTTTAALLFVLAVALAAATGGALAGVAASILSFLALNFFFTPPFHTFAVESPEDLVALVVFLVVSVVTGLLLSLAVREKERAERRELQTRLLGQFNARLLSGESVEKVLEAFAADLVSLLNLHGCEIETVMTDPITVVSGNDLEAGVPYEVPFPSTKEPVGTIRVTPAGSGTRLSSEEQSIIHNFAGQVALALESVRLADEVRSAQFDSETNRLRAALFSGVTHDLKTPLSAITASVTSLIEGSGFSNEERNDHLDTIKLEAEHLDRVVTNLMDLSRLRAGALVPAKAPGSIDELIEAVVARLQPILSNRDVHLDLGPDLPELSMDLVQIDQVLTNLIENAAKFSPPKTPIYVAAIGAPDRIRVTVADRGPGIPASERERLFQPFERGDGEVSGTGLGLAIARAVVVAHGGRLWAHENPGGGAALTFELPVDGEWKPT